MFCDLTSVAQDLLYYLKLGDGTTLMSYASNDIQNTLYYFH